MVVEKRLRGSGVGARLLTGAEAEARERGASEMVLHAQRRAESFYAGNGYVPEGDTFLEAEIEHVRMRKSLDA
jgi:predicted GNAT family N-acyltransferase